MKIQYQDYGAAANIVITSTVFEFRKHNRVVDAPCSARQASLQPVAACFS